jgi:hypothetical protein
MELEKQDNGGWSFGGVSFDGSSVLTVSLDAYPGNIIGRFVGLILHSNGYIEEKEQLQKRKKAV